MWLGGWSEKSGKIRVCCCRTLEDKEEALMKINGFELKGTKLKAFTVGAAKDPYQKAREANRGSVVDTRPLAQQIQVRVQNCGRLLKCGSRFCGF